MRMHAARPGDPIAVFIARPVYLPTRVYRPEFTGRGEGRSLAKSRCRGRRRLAMPRAAFAPCARALGRIRGRFGVRIGRVERPCMRASQAVRPCMCAPWRTIQLSPQAPSIISSGLPYVPASHRLGLARQAHRASAGGSGAGGAGWSAVQTCRMQWKHAVHSLALAFICHVMCASPRARSTVAWEGRGLRSMMCMDVRESRCRCACVSTARFGSACARGCAWVRTSIPVSFFLSSAQ